MAITMELNNILNVGTLLLLAIIGYFLREVYRDFKDHIKNHQEYQERTTNNQHKITKDLLLAEEKMMKEVNEVKYNYLDRFKELNEKVSDSTSGLSKEINETEKRLTQIITKQK